MPAGRVRESTFDRSQIHSVVHDPLKDLLFPLVNKKEPEELYPGRSGKTRPKQLTWNEMKRLAREVLHDHGKSITDGGTIMPCGTFLKVVAKAAVYCAK